MTTRRIKQPVAIIVAVTGVLLILLVTAFAWSHAHADDPEPKAESPASWRTDPAWRQGKAEWALYDAIRPIYGKNRHYEATIFTNIELVDPKTTTKTDDPNTPGAIEVFKHNVSELIPTEHYTYRFLTTNIVRSDDLSPYKITISSQEDCGSTYKQFLVHDGRVKAESHCYFPGAGSTIEEYPIPARLGFHDALTVTLRDFPFQTQDLMLRVMSLVPDQTDTHVTFHKPVDATLTNHGSEKIAVPYGTLDAYHLEVEHAADGGMTESHYWFAADPALRHVLVKYSGPYGVKYELKEFGWWRYWDQNEPRPR